MCFFRFSSRNTDLGCLFIMIGMIVSTALICGTVFYVVYNIESIIEKISKESQKVVGKTLVDDSHAEKVLGGNVKEVLRETSRQFLDDVATAVPRIVVDTIQRMQDPNPIPLEEGDKPANGIYSVQKGDHVFFQIDSINEDLNPVANPYFRLIGLKNGYKDTIDTTSYIKGSHLTCTNVSSPSDLSLSISEKDIENTDHYRFEVYTHRTGKDYQLLQGNSYPADQLKQWLRSNPKNLLKLDMLPSTSVTVKYVGKKGKYHNIQIVKYEIPFKSVNPNVKPILKDSIKIQVLNSSGKEVIPQNREYLLTGFENYSVRISEGKKSRTVLLTNLFNRLNTHFKNSKGKTGPVYFQFNYPDSGIQLKVTFKGIHRTYMVSNVNIPKSTDDRTLPHLRFSIFGGSIRTYAPSRIEIRVIQNGKVCLSTTSEIEGWCLDFCHNKSNQFSIREGLGNRYSVQIIHKKSGDIFTELTELTDFNFKGRIKENDDQRQWKLIFPGTISMEFKPIK